MAFFVCDFERAIAIALKPVEQLLGLVLGQAGEARPALGADLNVLSDSLRPIVLPRTHGSLASAHLDTSGRWSAISGRSLSPPTQWGRLAPVQHSTGLPTVAINADWVIDCWACAVLIKPTLSQDKPQGVGDPEARLRLGIQSACRALASTEKQRPLGSSPRLEEKRRGAATGNCPGVDYRLFGHQLPSHRLTFPNADGG
jgi:hypothetical protein